MFKKREIKARIRKSDEVDDYEDTTDSVNHEAISLLHEKHADRKRVKYNFSELSNDTKIKDNSKSASLVTQSIKAMIGTQFSVKSEDYSKYNAHEKIMENYINQRLGLTSDDKDSTDNLNDGGKNETQDNDLGIIGVGAGIAEVELPSTYKSTNIIETESAKTMLQQKKQQVNKALDINSSSSSNRVNKATQILSSYRFQKPIIQPFKPQLSTTTTNNRNIHTSSESTLHDISGHSTSNSVLSINVIGPITPQQAENDPLNNTMNNNVKSNYRMRSDDLMMQRFKKSSYLDNHNGAINDT